MLQLLIQIFGGQKFFGDVKFFILKIIVVYCDFEVYLLIVFVIFLIS